MQRCYKYPPTPLSEHKVMCIAHGPFFTRLQYNQLAQHLIIEVGIQLDAEEFIEDGWPVQTHF